MGQYWIPVNLDKHEYIHPHKLGCGLKLLEQFDSHPGTGAALIALLVAMPERRGGGDLGESPVIGRWAGDRIVIIGDYAEDGDIPGYNDIPENMLYTLCRERTTEEQIDYVTWMINNGRGEYVGVFLANQSWTDISELVAEIIENELGGEYGGDGWRSFKYKDGHYKWVENTDATEESDNA